jgi:lysophospholipase L1-like esterase
MRPRALSGLVVAILIGLSLGAVTGCNDSPTRPGPVVPPPQPPAPTPAPAPPAPPPPAPRLRVTRILAFGDSMTAGTTSPPLPSTFLITPGIPQSYPYKLQEMLTARYTDQSITVANAGYPGWRATALYDELMEVASATNPEVVLMMAGANDLLNDKAEGVEPAADAVEDMMRRMVERGIAVLLATLPPQRASGRRGAGAPFVAEYNERLEHAASVRGGAIVDVYARLSLSLVGEDGLHLTEAGNQRLAEIWLDALRSQFETTVSSAPSVK